jgi:hypothetical protein
MAFAESETNERSDGDVGPLQTPGRRVRAFAFCSFPGLFLPFSCIGGLATRSSSSDQIEVPDILEQVCRGGTEAATRSDCPPGWRLNRHGNDRRPLTAARGLTRRPIESS